MSNARNIANLPNGDDVSPVYACRAYIVFDGTFAFASTSTVYTPASSPTPIYHAENIASIIEKANSEYIINFSQDMPNNRYVVVGSNVGSIEHNFYSVIVSDYVASYVDKFNIRCVHTASGSPAPQDPIQIAVIQ